MECIKLNKLKSFNKLEKIMHVDKIMKLLKMRIFHENEYMGTKIVSNF